MGANNPQAGAAADDSGFEIETLAGQHFTVEGSDLLYLCWKDFVDSDGVRKLAALVGPDFEPQPSKMLVLEAALVDTYTIGSGKEAPYVGVMEPLFESEVDYHTDAAVDDDEIDIWGPCPKCGVRIGAHTRLETAQCFGDEGDL